MNISPRGAATDTLFHILPRGECVTVVVTSYGRDGHRRVKLFALDGLRDPISGMLIDPRIVEITKLVHTIFEGWEYSERKGIKIFQPQHIVRMLALYMYTDGNQLKARIV